jgi:hypothetical protein
VGIMSGHYIETETFTKTGQTINSIEVFGGTDQRIGQLARPDHTFGVS